MYPEIFSKYSFKKIKNFLKNQIDIFLANKKLKSHGFWFIDIPRTSSSSVKVAMNKYFGWPYGKYDLFEKEFSSHSPYPDHLLVEEVIDLVGQRNWKKLRKFTIVRNPYERIISIYLYNLKMKVIHNSLSINEFVKCMFDYKYKDIKWKFLEWEKRWLPAHDFLIKNGKIAQDITIIKYENRENELYEFFERKIEREALSIKIQDTNLKNNFNLKDLNIESIKIINKIYEKDFFYFGYEKKNNFY